MKKQIFGAILLSAALAVGTAMPAFAAGTQTDTLNSQGTVGSDSSYTISSVAGKGGETKVNISTVVTQINVAVPLKVDFFAETGGGTLGVPSDGVYKLKNYSANTVYVVGIETTAVNTTDWAPASRLTDSSLDKADDTVTYGSIYAEMKGTYTGAKAIVLTDSQNGGEYDSTGKIAMPAATNSSTPGEVVFNFVGKNSVLNKDAGNTAQELTKITYIVSINPSHNADPNA